MAMLSEFQFMWDGDIGQMSIINPCIVFTGEKVQPITSAPYLEERKARKFGKSKIGKTR